MNDTLNIVILAAGSSSRMGRPKQKLLFDNETLLQRAISQARRVSDKVIVVLGATASEISASIHGYEVSILHNPNWEEGMASSIRTAVAYLQTKHDTGSILFMVCDQPFAGADFLQQLKENASKTDKGIVASAYSDTVGVPVIFKAVYFQHLRALTGNEGAKKIVLSHPEDVLMIPFPEGGVDIDTEKDYQLLIKAAK